MGGDGGETLQRDQHQPEGRDGGGRGEDPPEQETRTREVTLKIDGGQEETARPLFKKRKPGG